MLSESILDIVKCSKYDDDNDDDDDDDDDSDDDDDDDYDVFSSPQRILNTIGNRVGPINYDDEDYNDNDDDDDDDEVYLSLAKFCQV